MKQIFCPVNIGRCVLWSCSDLAECFQGEDVHDDGYLDLVVKAQTSLKRGEDLESPFTVASVMSSGDTELFAYATTAEGTELLFSSMDTTFI